MCGIAGFLNFSNWMSEDEAHAIVSHMTDTLWHRGPDDFGVWVDAEVGIVFGHRRLSILDLSPKGHQPMHSSCGRYTIIFNGEVYNFRKLRRDLEEVGKVFFGRSDTEVALEAISQWGLKNALRQFNGMFAFALWDHRERALHLVRDRIGKKPLYYGWMGKTFLFGSELKALRAHPDFETEVSRDALVLYLRHNCIPAPYCIYDGIYKLPPGMVLSICADRRPETGNQELKPETYWSAKEIVEQGVANPFKGSEEDAVDHLADLLQDAIRLRMESDVPLGVFLSGGVDSSTVAALMQQHSDCPIKSFTVGLYENDYNESEYAKKVARHLGTEHTELFATMEEARQVIPRLAHLYDEPFSDSSQIPTFLVSELTQQHVTVSLSGDGGDELFAGYNRHLWVPKVWKTIQWMPMKLRKVTAQAFMTISPEAWESLFLKMDTIIPDKWKQRVPGQKLHKLAQVLDGNDPEAIYIGLASHWKNPDTLVLGAAEPITLITDKGRWANFSDFTQQMMYLDLVTYLPDDILVKVDRASMGVSLEVRAPFLDYRIVEFAWRIPLSMKVKNGQGKWLLRQVLYSYVPKELIERPKTGFGVPIHEWLRGPLRDWAESLIGEDRLRKDGIFDPRPIREKWSEHLSGSRNWQTCLWDILMFQAWKDYWVPDLN